MERMEVTQRKGQTGILFIMSMNVEQAKRGCYRMLHDMQKASCELELELEARGWSEHRND